ncbi:MAG TPA: PRC-barrel domain-containing protein [Aggregatilineaceae bacterium]|nr:PRC-barrel domain-containing protein [Aggregatilineaceae bacterium]
MQFTRGTGVYTADNEKIGEIARVVLDPITKEVTHLVVQRGFLFVEDRLVPVELIAEAKEDRVTLVSRLDSLDDLQFFEEQLYVPTEEALVDEVNNAAFASTLYWYPSIGATWGAGPVYPLSADMVTKIETKRNIPEDKVALKEGAKVTSADGKQLGAIGRVYVDERNDEATHFLITKGTLFKEYKLVPMAWVKAINEDEVELAVKAAVIERLEEINE